MIVKVDDVAFQNSLLDYFFLLLGISGYNLLGGKQAYVGLLFLRGYAVIYHGSAAQHSFDGSFYFT